MNVDDLKYIFKHQLTEGTTNLYFMVVEEERITVLRHPTDELSGLLPMLDSLQYAGHAGEKVGNMPKFTK